MKVYASVKDDQLAKRVVESLDTTLHVLNVSTFLDGETHIDLQEQVVGEDVFVIHSYHGSPNDWYVSALLIADLFRRSGVNKVYLIAPYLVYARQDVPDGTQHSAYASPVICQGLSGFDHVCVVDLHAQQTQGFFQVPVTSLSSLETLVGFLNQQEISDLVLVSPDFGGSKRVQSIQEAVGCDIAVIEKQRGERIESLKLLGDVRQKHCLLIDDVMVSGESLKSASYLLKNQGAETVGAYVTHSLHSDIEAWKADAQIDYFYTSDTVAGDAVVDQKISIAPQVVAFIKQQQGVKDDS
ncbi:ribose-phosphate diphosphokinase [Gammaproteobacteria bacterium]|nr:ribose-phosphate diphosphokinase [Gammaproteobacteria bacterium]